MKRNQLVYLITVFSLVACLMLPGPGWAADAELIKKAKAEGTLSVYSTFPVKALSALLKAFEEKYGIKTEYYRQSSTAVVEKYLTEAEARSVMVDIIQPSDPVPMVELAKRGQLMGYISPEFKAFDQRFIGPEGRYFYPVFNLLNVIYNKKYVKESEVPKKWEDFINPKWKGKIVTGNPIAGGTSYAWYYMARKKYGKEYHEKLAALKPKIVTATAAMQQMVVAGEVYLCNEMLQYRPWGLLKKDPQAPIGVSWPAPTPVAPRTSGIVIQAPHPNAAKLYHDFLASEEGQKIAAVKFGSFSPRGLRPEGLPDIKTLDLFLIGPEEMPAFTGMRKELNAEFKRLYMSGK